MLRSPVWEPGNAHARVVSLTMSNTLCKQTALPSCNKQHDASPHFSPMYPRVQEVFHFRSKNKSDYISGKAAVSTLRKTPGIPYSSQLKTTISGSPPLANDASLPPLLDSEAQWRNLTPTSKSMARPNPPNASLSADC